ncbi:protein adenylyltransferase SelO [Aliiglaciecola lipolytica]|uniref:protein adenylyltransferase SelO n=1 Tax=Aliiglaciecola lipolytica TaxID=477689 RepID=UPI001C0A4C08|nr:YdiU family protein [Aliiglaciecola lipolytica]
MHFDHSYAQKLSNMVSQVRISPLLEPELALYNYQLAEDIELKNEFSQAEILFRELFEPEGQLNQHAIAQKYGGHQFGGWNPELGDGRGVLLAEVITQKQKSWDLHLKGAGKTPYSRFGDGRAVLRSTIREYLASEALHSLGIPTSRALCLISSKEIVYREQPETGAMLIRACQSHIRFGHFEYFYQTKQLDKLDNLFKYTFQKHYPELLNHDNPHYSLLEQIVLDTADLIAKWQAYGFCHGVMNTDNMSIHGITFDFGPYAFLDTYDPEYICNHSDHSGRYAFDQQPSVALWNLNALAHAFTAYLSIEQIKQALTQYETRLQTQYAELMRLKFGFKKISNSHMTLVNDWLALLAQDKRDYTQSFRLLCDENLNIRKVADHFIDRTKAESWYSSYIAKLAEESIPKNERLVTMKEANPKFILRNYLAQNAINEAEKGSFDECKRLLKVLSNPFDEQPEFERYAQTPPDWGQSMEISCSS